MKKFVTFSKMQREADFNPMRADAEEKQYYAELIDLLHQAILGGDNQYSAFLIKRLENFRMWLSVK